jgi:predicted SAM-dependent methyltransferase
MQKNENLWNSFCQKKDPKIIELGPGIAKKYPNSIGLDIVDKESVDFQCDLSKGLGFIPSNSLDLVYSSHLLEHIEDLEFLMKEVERVLKPGGRMVSIVPHFSNPYFYSDYTHKTFWGLYTLFYFSNDKYFKREVPTYYNSIDFQIINIKLVFNSPFKIRSIIYKLVEKVINMNNFSLEFYEENLTGLIQCQEIHFEIEKRHG